MKFETNNSGQGTEDKVYINTNPEDIDLYYTSEAALEAPVEYIVVS
ncbi:MAG: hypothetical protein WBL21_08060 [Salinimicrobium sp.]